MLEESAPRVTIKIVDFHPRYSHLFRDLNYEWLEEFFEIEPYDRIVLGDPQKHIIRHGGCILFAQVKREIVGTCALQKHTEKKYELAKMSVSSTHRGNGIGHALARAAIERARTLGADKLVLATSKKLLAANHLYESLGFKYVDLSEIGPLPYKRESVVMALKL
jgi:ribosomal protein S18 acetylase RimI-like enzyme